jgi:hypothetical protein
MKSSTIKLSILCIGILASTVACKSYSKTTVEKDISGPTVIQKPVVADLEVGQERISGTVTDKRSVPLNELKRAALTDALTKSKSDVLVEPRYEVTTDARKTTVTVTGYPAKYKNFRPMEAKDTMFIDKTQLSTSSKNPILKRQNGRRNKIIGWSAGGVAGAIGIFFLTILFL